MAEFHYDKKREHEKLAAAAIDGGEFDKAFFHIKEAVKHAMVLAERCGGVLGRAYVANANGLLDVAEKLKERMGRRTSEEKSPMQVPASGGSDAPSFAVSTVKGIRMADVIGLDDAKQVVSDALINPIRHPDIYKILKVKPGTGLLLYGPPRTGKTMFARAVASEMDCAFIHVKSSDLKSKYVGETEKNVAAVFKEARQHERCVLFFDDCEQLFSRRGNQKANAVGQFLVELDGFEKDEAHKVFVLLATNRPWLITSAITASGRISASAYVGLPNQEARKRIIESALKDVPLEADVDIGKLAELTDGYAAGEINHTQNGGGVCNVAGVLAARRWIELRKGLQEGGDEWQKVVPIAWADFEEALRKVVPVSRRDADIIKRNLDFSRTGATADDGSADDE